MRSLLLDESRAGSSRSTASPMPWRAMHATWMWCIASTMPDAAAAVRQRRALCRELEHAGAGAARTASGRRADSSSRLAAPSKVSRREPRLLVDVGGVLGGDLRRDRCGPGNELTRLDAGTLSHGRIIRRFRGFRVRRAYTLVHTDVTRSGTETRDNCNEHIAHGSRAQTPSRRGAATSRRPSRSDPTSRAGTLIVRIVIAVLVIGGVVWFLTSRDKPEANVGGAGASSGSGERVVPVTVHVADPRGSAGLARGPRHGRRGPAGDGARAGRRPARQGAVHRGPGRQEGRGARADRSAAVPRAAAPGAGRARARPGAARRPRRRNLERYKGLRDAEPRRAAAGRRDRRRRSARTRARSRSTRPQIESAQLQLDYARGQGADRRHHRRARSSTPATSCARAIRPGSS